MPKSRFLANVGACFIVPFVLVLIVAAPAQAQVNRSFVSTGGNDANTVTGCTFSAPCRNFGAAIGITNPGGEVVALDSGGYGNGGNTTTINKAVTIDAANVHAAVSTSAGQDSFVIAAGSSDVVVFRGLTMLGGNHSATNGVTINTAGAVFLEGCQIQGYATNGVNVSGTSSVKVLLGNSEVRDNTNDGVFVTTSSGTASAFIHDTFFSKNGNAGVEAGANSKVSVAHSAANFGGAGFLVSSASGDMTTLDVSAVNNTTGLSSSAGTLRLAYSMVTQNGTGLSASGGSLLGSSPGTSAVAGNTSDGTTTSTFTLK
jgi:hypothetical protein